MAFKKGQPRPANGGRRKGTANKVNAAVHEQLEILGCNPVIGLAKIAQNEDNPIEVRERAYSTLMRYIHPQLKSIEHRGTGPSGEILTSDVSARELLASRIAGLTPARPAGENNQGNAGS